MDRDISPPPSKRLKAGTASSSSGTLNQLGTKLSVPEPTEPSTRTQQQQQLSQSLPRRKPKTLRIFSWNINGLTPFLQQPITSFFSPTKTNKLQSRNANASHTSDATVGGASGSGSVPTASFRDFLTRHGNPEVLFLQELKIARNDTTSLRTLRALLAGSEKVGRSRRGEGGRDDVDDGEKEQQQQPTYQPFFNLPTDPYNAKGRVYGVAALIHSSLLANSDGGEYSLGPSQQPTSPLPLPSSSPLTSPPTPTPTLTTPPWDTEGRIQLLLLPSHNLALYNIYAVNGTSLPYYDTLTGNLAGTRHDKKRILHALLAADCARLERYGWDVVVIGDLNVAPGEGDGFPGLRTWPKVHVENRRDFWESFLGGAGRGGEGTGAKSDGVADGIDGGFDVRVDSKAGEVGASGQTSKTDAQSPEPESSNDEDHGDRSLKPAVERKKLNIKNPAASHSSQTSTTTTITNPDEARFDGVDVWRWLKGDERKYTWFSRTKEWGSCCDRVDLVIASRCMAERGRIVDVGILDSPAERGPSDHVPIWVEVKAQMD